MGMMIRRNRGRRKAPVQPKKVEKKVEPVVEETKTPTEEVETNTEVAEGSETPVDEITSNLDFTANDIENMNYFKLKSLAKKNGIEVEGRDAKDIRVDLIEKLGL